MHLAQEDFAQWLSARTREERVAFLERLAQNLTVAVRVIHSDVQLSDGKKLAQIKLVNEIQHRVVSRIPLLRVGLDEWTEADFARMVFETLEQCPPTTGPVLYAILFSMGIMS